MITIIPITNIKNINSIVTLTIEFMNKNMKVENQSLAEEFNYEQ